jgi:hypothetical protein
LDPLIKSQQALIDSTHFFSRLHGRGTISDQQLTNGIPTGDPVRRYCPVGGLPPWPQSFLAHLSHLPETIPAYRLIASHIPNFFRSRRPRVLSAGVCHAAVIRREDKRMLIECSLRAAHRSKRCGTALLVVTHSGILRPWVSCETNSNGW